MSADQEKQESFFSSSRRLSAVRMWEILGGRLLEMVGERNKRLAALVGQDVVHGVARAAAGRIVQAEIARIEALEVEGLVLHLDRQFGALGQLLEGLQGGARILFGVLEGERGEEDDLRLLRRRVGGNFGMVHEHRDGLDVVADAVRLADRIEIVRHLFHLGQSGRCRCWPGWIWGPDRA